MCHNNAVNAWQAYNHAYIVKLCVDWFEFKIKVDVPYPLRKATVDVIEEASHGTAFRPDNDRETVRFVQHCAGSKLSRLSVGRFESSMI